MKKIALVTIGLMLVLFSLPLMSATFLGGQGTVTNVSGNVSELLFNITTTQTTVNPGIGENVTYHSMINISTVKAGATYFNISNFTFNLPDNNTYDSLTSFLLTNSTAGGIGNISPVAYTIGQGAGLYTYIHFSVSADFANITNPVDLNGTINQTVWNLTWIASAPIASTKISTSLTGRAYTETWNITSANSNLTLDNASLVVRPSRWNLRIGAPTTVTFNSTAFTTYSVNRTDIEAWTDLNIGTNMIEGGSGYETLSITYNGPTISASSGSTPSAAVSVIPTEARQIALWVIGIIATLIVIGGATWLVLGLRKR